MKTFHPKKGEIKETWYEADATGQILGRLATKVAALLRGKELVTFTPAVNPMVKVVITNADKIKVTGAKLSDKKYYRHSGYMGNLKTTTLEELLVKKPTEAIRKAVTGMLPKNRLGRAILENLYIYSEAEHPHGGGQPKAIKF